MDARTRDRLARFAAAAVAALDQAEPNAVGDRACLAYREAARCLALHEAHAPVQDSRPPWAVRAWHLSRHAALLARVDAVRRAA